MFAAALAAAPDALAAQETGSDRYLESIAGTVVDFEMILVPPSEGTAAGEVGPFWLGATEVTWDLYDLFVFGTGAGVDGAEVGVSRPSRPYVLPGDAFGHSGNPALGMTFMAAEHFVRWLSGVTGRAYRLPTEAEWEHACRSGDAESGDLSERAWHSANAGRRTHRVGTRQQDALGFHDLLGNAAEWVTTRDGEPVVKGGAYSDPPGQVTCASRRAYQAAWQMTDPQLPKSQWWLSDAPFVGLRIARDL
jgi:formylglycine-generating enzyme required for sulfatase activity